MIVFHFRINVDIYRERTWETNVVLSLPKCRWATQFHLFYFSVNWWRRDVMLSVYRPYREFELSGCESLQHAMQSIVHNWSAFEIITQTMTTYYPLVSALHERWMETYENLLRWSVKPTQKVEIWLISRESSVLILHSSAYCLRADDTEGNINCAQYDNFNSHP